MTMSQLTDPSTSQVFNLNQHDQALAADNQPYDQHASQVEASNMAHASARSTGQTVR
jgi:hypothetical protein